MARPLSLSLVLLFSTLVTLISSNRAAGQLSAAGEAAVAGMDAAARSKKLTRLPYNHPGLAVDLGVGLWAWPIPSDADGDGDYDLVVSCPDKPSNGVWFFENATGDTRSVKFPLFKPARRLSVTTHYVMPSYVDGVTRVLSPGLEYTGFLSRGTAERTAIPSALDFHCLVGRQTKGPKIRHRQWRLADYDGDGLTDLVFGIEDWSEYGWDDAWDASGRWTAGPLHGFVYWARNTGTRETVRYAAPAKVLADGRPIDVFGCPSPNFEDFDHDGDLDLLCGEFLDGFTYFENVGTRREPRYAAGQRLQTANGQPLTMDLQMIVPIAFDWDRDGDVDLVVGDEDGRVALVEAVSVEPRSSSPRSSPGRSPPPRFLPPRYFQQEADMLKCGALATPFGHDWDGDGDIDIVSGNTAGYFEWFENLSGPKVASPRWAAPRRLGTRDSGDRAFRVQAGPNGSIQGPAEAKWGYTTFTIADWDGDSLPDIVFNSIWGRVQWLHNVGTRRQPLLDAPQPVEFEFESTDGKEAKPAEQGVAIPRKPAWTWWEPAPGELVTQWRTTPVAFDCDGDGLIDLMMLDSEGYLSWHKRDRRGDRLRLGPPSRNFVDADGQPLRLNSRTAGASGRRKLAVTDWDGDGQWDLLVNSTNADLWRGLGRREGQWRFERIGSLAEQNIEGHDVSPATVDFDGDGVPDFLGGAEDGRFYFLANPRSQMPRQPR